MNRVSADIVIVNWNSGERLKECLQSISEATKESFVLDRLVVVDNASSDSSADDIQVDLPLFLIRNEENRGFAAACNQGARSGWADYVLFLNPDMVLYRDSLDVAMAFMRQPESSRIGICGIQLVDEKGEIDRGCARFPVPLDFFHGMLGLHQIWPARFPNHMLKEWDHTTGGEVDHVTGAFFLVRRSLFEALQGFDERFFVYLDDLDFSYRARRAGWSSYYLAETRAYHQGGYTHERSDITWIHHSLSSRILYGFKHFHTGPAVVLAMGTLCLEPVLRLVQAASKRSFHLIRDTLAGYIRLWSDLPRIFLYLQKDD